MIRARVAVAVAVAVGAIFAGPPAPARASSPPRTVACRVRADPAAVAGAAELRRLNAVADRLSPRPTGSAAQRRFVDWLERRAKALPGVRARVTLVSRRAPVTTRTLTVTVPGSGRERVVVDSHTDGTNAVEDNGPIAMLAIARYLSGLPSACRRRPVQFSFSTGHFYQRLVSPARRHGGTGVVARRLDRDYDGGTVAGVVVVEHLGAREWTAAPRADGVGRVLRLTGRPELTLVGVSESPKLVGGVETVIRRHDLRRTALLRGADGAVAERVPPRCSFGGEGTPFNERLLPTVATIAAPQTLYNAPFGFEGIDFGLMRAQTLAYTDLVLRLERMSRADIAGRVLDFRARRRAGTATCTSP